MWVNDLDRAHRRRSARGHLFAASPKAHHAHRLPVSVEIRPHVGATLAASGANETLLDIRQTDIIRPAVGVDCDGMAAFVIGAIDQNAAYSHVAHLAEGDLGRALGHRDQSTSAARFIAGEFGFFTLISASKDHRDIRDRVAC
jgi:hypothetical protein